MNIETKFTFGQRVQAITRGSEEKRKKCEFCEGLGSIPVKGKAIQCPECYGNGYTTHYEDTKWYIPTDDFYEIYNFVIQKIGAELFNPNNKKWNGKRSWIYYMAADSGTMIDENDCFSSIEEAQEECDRRNKND